MYAHQRVTRNLTLAFAQSLSKGFAVVTVAIDFKVHRAACVSVPTLTDRFYSKKRDLKAIL